MGQAPSGGAPGRGGKDNKKDQQKKWEPPLPTRVGKKKKRGPDSSSKLPTVYPNTRCRLKLLKLERIKDHLLLEEEFVQNQERLKPQEDKDAEERTRVDDLRGSLQSICQEVQYNTDGRVIPKVLHYDLVCSYHNLWRTRLAGAEM